MLLKDQNAIIYGAAGAIGSAVAKTFAREGARVFLAGRTLAKLDEVAQEIKAAGGEASTGQVDALDSEAVRAHADAVAHEAGRIDVSFNAIGVDHIQGVPLRELSAVFERIWADADMTPDQMQQDPGVPGKLLGRSPTLDDLANAATFHAFELGHRHDRHRRRPAPGDGTRRAGDARFRPFRVMPGSLGAGSNRVRG